MGKYKVLKRVFFDREPEIVARDLLGKFIIRKFNGSKLVGMIVETEAYLAFNDPASHNFNGMTVRNRIMYGEPGYAYVHSQRHHYLIDFVTLGEGLPGSVLIRAIEPVDGTAVMKKLRGTDISNLTNGPAKLCEALAINRSFNGHDITDPESDLFVVQDLANTAFRVVTAKRIGISKATDLPLRFYIEGNIFVSKPISNR